MIQLTRINKASLVLNADLIEQIETTPDTVISLTNGQKYVVLESAAEVMEKAIEYQRQIRQPPATLVARQSPFAEDPVVHNPAASVTESAVGDAARPTSERSADMGPEIDWDASSGKGAASDRSAEAGVAIEPGDALAERNLARQAGEDRG